MNSNYPEKVNAYLHELFNLHVHDIDLINEITLYYFRLKSKSELDEITSDDKLNQIFEDAFIKTFGRPIFDQYINTGEFNIDLISDDEYHNLIMEWVIRFTTKKLEDAGLLYIFEQEDGLDVCVLTEKGKLAAV